MALSKEKSEKKTKRISVVFKPKDYENFRKACDLNGLPVNIVINQLANEYSKKNLKDEKEE